MKTSIGKFSTSIFRKKDIEMGDTMDPYSHHKSLTDGQRDSRFEERKTKRNNTKKFQGKSAIFSLILLASFFTMLWFIFSPDEEIVVHEYVFEGEGTNWSAVLFYDGQELWGEDESGVTTYKSHSNYTFELTYNGGLEELAPMEKLECRFTRGTTGEGSVRLTFEDEPVSKTVFSTSGGGTGAVMQEDMIVEVDVQWDDKEESFELVVE
ncbi:hypothetical protein LGQ02_03885 [Bacillus shivajii]|uniref:hypothetical protein n=1 Tax=Bacillus shivajii TaxID=1983719 RepID=UPI001CFA9E01|nr:hypothetical protein [Bacillus shivajii]UCZ53934.1 hypothetical protein LGQ02_03885 [Bacillus shivajii]